MKITEEHRMRARKLCDRYGYDEAERYIEKISRKKEVEEPTVIHYRIVAIIIVSLIMFGIYFTINNPTRNNVKENQEQIRIEYLLNEIETYKDEYKKIDFLNSDYMKNRKHKKIEKSLDRKYYKAIKTLKKIAVDNVENLSVVQKEKIKEAVEIFESTDIAYKRDVKKVGILFLLSWVFLPLIMIKFTG